MAPAHDARDALAALETRAIRDKERLTYNSTLGSVCVFLVASLGLLLPSPWRVLNGDWSSSLVVSLLGLASHGVLVVSVVVAFRCAQVQAAELWDQFAEKARGSGNIVATPRYLSSSQRAQPEPPAPVDRRAALHDVVNLKSVRPSGSSLSPANKTTASAADAQQRSFFDPPAVTTVDQGKAYMRRLQKAAREKEANEDSFQPAGSFGGAAGYPGENFGIYGSGALLPRVYQASGFDPSLRDTSEEKEEDALTTSSNPQVAWAQLEDVGLAMFMHLYVRNIRRLLACHVKDFVEAFVQNSLELNECGVMADVLLRRVPAQALLCPPTGAQLPQQQQLTNVSLFDMVSAFKHHPAFMSKTRSVYLFEEHVTFDKYLNVGEATNSEFSSLERQEYVLERLIMLSKDRNLDRFRWDKGATTYKGKPWTESLPSDIDILMNVFCCIMDNMLPVDDAKDRPFTKSFFMGKAPRRPFTPQMRSRIYFVKTVQRPPHYKILAKAVVREIVPCEENCFHAIIVYLHALKKHKAGHLESINMRRILDQVFDITK